MRWSFRVVSCVMVCFMALWQTAAETRSQNPQVAHLFFASAFKDRHAPQIQFYRSKAP